MFKTDHNFSALHSIYGPIRARYAQAVLALALLCSLTPVVFSEPDAPLRYRPGLRNSSGSQRLNERQLQAVLDSLRHKTSFLEMGFDESGFLTLGDRARIAGGSATARALIVAAVDGTRGFELESHYRSPHIAFARLAIGHIYEEVNGARIEVTPLQLDFTDFAHLSGNREALAAFDPGIAVLHELGHGVLDLKDAVGDATQPGECDEHVNRMRRELELPERQHYSPRLRMVGARGLAGMIAEAELLFVRTGNGSGRAKAEKYYVRWEVEKVSNLTITSSRKERAALLAAAQ